MYKASLWFIYHEAISAKRKLSYVELNRCELLVCCVIEPWLAGGERNPAPCIYEWDWWLQWTIVDRSQAHTHDSHTWSLLWIAWWLPEYFIRWNHNFVIRRVRAICKRMANRKYNEHISLSRSSASVVIILQSQWNDGINTQCHQNTWFPLLSGAHALRHAPEMDCWLMFVRTPWNACKYAISKWHNLDAFASVANTSIAKTHALRPSHTISFSK